MSNLSAYQRLKVQNQISNRIKTILSNKKLSQVDFANLMGKHESEISKWLSGEHNFTIVTIKAIEYILQDDIIEIKT